MTIREKLVSKIHKLPESQILEIYKFVEEVEGKGDESSLMERLRKIKIQGPRDFSRNIDLYMSGEKSIDENLD